MKILLAATSVEDFSGASKCLRELAVALKQKGHEVEVVLPKSGGEIEKVLWEEKIPFFVVRQYQCWYKELDVKLSSHNISILIKRILNRISIEKCKKILRNNRYDIVHVNAVTAYVVGKAAIEEKVPTIWHIREFMEEDLGITFINHRWSLKLLNQASRFVAISNPIYEKWKKVLNPQIDIVPDGVLMENYFVKEKKEHDKLKVLIYGRIVPGKGQLFFIKGVKKVITQINKLCEFCIAGTIEDEDYYKKCISYIADNNLENNITYIGQIRDIKGLLSETDIVCVCSAMEGFGRVTVEAMLGKCLVIGARMGATKDLIKDNQTGYLYEENNIEDFSRILTLCINHFDEYVGVVQCGQEYALKNFTVENNVEKVLNVYRHVENM